MNGMLKLDLSGTSVHNRIINEKHKLERIPDKKDRIICPKYGSYYVESLSIRDDNTSRPLIQGEDYLVAYHDPDFSKLTGKDIESLIIIINESVSENVRISYQALGGKLTIERDFLYEELQGVDESTMTYSFYDIIGTPTEYPGDADHPHEWWQIYGFDSLIENLEMLYRAISAGRTGYYNALNEYAELYKDIILQALDEFESNKEHLTDYNNPHQTDKTKAGLSEIHNWPIAGQVQSLDTTRDDVYMGISGVSSQFKNYVYPDLSAHLTDFNNPHRLTAEQLGIFDKSEVDGLYSDRLLRTSSAYDSKLLDGKNVAKLTTDVKTNLAASNVDSNTTFRGERITDDFNSASGLQVFFGDGRLKPFDSIKPANVERGWLWKHSTGVAASETAAWTNVIGYQAAPGEKIFKSFWFKPNKNMEAISFLIGRRESNGTTTRII